ncbi:MAG: hypothetical protein FJY85_20730 [Deltaproteobacteria bacterium]|nr:hypothetical protein [Deltaproteobacteria bacterium]
MPPKLPPELKKGKYVRTFFTEREYRILLRETRNRGHVGIGHLLRIMVDDWMQAYEIKGWSAEKEPKKA